VKNVSPKQSTKAEHMIAACCCSHDTVGTQLYTIGEKTTIPYGIMYIQREKQKNTNNGLNNGSTTPLPIFFYRV